MADLWTKPLSFELFSKFTKGTMGWDIGEAIESLRRGSEGKQKNKVTVHDPTGKRTGDESQLSEGEHRDMGTANE